MSSTKYTRNNSRKWGGSMPNSTKVVIDSHAWSNEREHKTEYICKNKTCNMILHPLDDKGETYWCSWCNEKTYPKQELSKRKDIIGVKRKRNFETVVSCPDYSPNVSIKKQPELKSGFLALSQKGFKFTSYSEFLPG
jgi:hypothetical protein